MTPLSHLRLSTNSECLPSSPSPHRHSSRWTHRLLQSYAEEHAIQDLLYHLADGHRRQAIGLDIYLKVRFASSLSSSLSSSLV